MRKVSSSHARRHLSRISSAIVLAGRVERLTQQWSVLCQKGWPPNLKEATAAREHGGKHDPKSFAQELVLTPQTPFDLGHQIYGEAQVLRGLLQGLDGLLCLVVITCEALLRCEAATLSDFRVFFHVSCGGGHGVLLASVGGFSGGRLPKGTRHMPPRVCAHGVTSASRAPRTSRFLLSTMCGIHTPERPIQFLHRLLHAASA